MTIENLNDIDQVGFTRRVIGGLIGYFHENIKYLDSDANGVDLQEKNFPVAFQKNTNMQWSYDNFYDQDLQKGNCYANGDVRKVPSAVLAFDGGFSINYDFSTAANVAMLRDIRKDSEWVGQTTKVQFTRIKAFLPFEFSFILKFRTANLAQSFLVSEAFFDQHHKRRLIKHSFRGLKRLPIEIEMGGNLASKRKVNYRFSEGSDKYMEFDIPIKVIAYYPSLNTSVDYVHTMQTAKITIDPNNESERQDNQN